MRKKTIKKIEKIVDSDKREEYKMIRSLESIIEDINRSVNDFKVLEREAPTPELRSFFHDIVEDEVSHLEELKEKLTTVKLINR